MKENMDIINQNSTNKKSLFIYIVLGIVFLSLSAVAIFLSFQIKTIEKKSTTPQKSSTTASPSAIVAPTSTLPKITYDKFVDSEFLAQYVPGMKLVKSTFEKGKKYSFSDDQITYDIYIGTGWVKDDPSRNFNNKDVTINFSPAYNFTDNFSYIGFDFIGQKTKKYVTAKCTYGSATPILLSKCQDLLGSFYLIGE